MDIAKIRKKALAQGQAKKAEERSAPPDEAVLIESEAPPETPEPDHGKEIVHGQEDAAAHSADQEAADQPATFEPAGSMSSEAAPEITELLTFSLDTEEFAFKVGEVEEIIKFQSITLLPTMPDYVSGITSLRGKIIPVIDLKKRLALKSMPTGGSGPVLSHNDWADRKEKIIILAGPRGLIGAIIDRVMGVVRLPADMILDPPPHLTEEETRFIEGVVIIDKRFISIISSENALEIEVE